MQTLALRADVVGHAEPNVKARLIMREGAITMVIIEHRKAQWKWILGIFQEAQDADAFLSRLPDGSRDSGRRSETPRVEYPIYLGDLADDQIVSSHELQAVLEG